MTRWAAQVAARLIDQTALPEFLPLCLEKGIGVILGGPYNSGILASGATPGAKFENKDAPAGVVNKVRQIESVCGRHGVPLRAAALQFPLAHPAVAAVIPGSRSLPEQVIHLDGESYLCRRSSPGDDEVGKQVDDPIAIFELNLKFLMQKEIATRQQDGAIIAQLSPNVAADSGNAGAKFAALDHAATHAACAA